MKDYIEIIENEAEQYDLVLKRSLTYGAYQIGDLIDQYFSPSL